jgi:hypothetical protein
MAELLVMVCLLSSPDQCAEKPVTGGNTADVVSCIKQGGDKALEWQKQHSEYLVIGWRCAKKS